VLCFVAEIGVARNLLASMPHSDRPAADFVRAALMASGVAYVLGVGFAYVLPLIVPATGSALSGWRPWLFGAMVTGTALNLVTDVAFLSLRRVRGNLVVTGIGMGLLKCGLLFVFAHGGVAGINGAFGIAVANGLAALVCAITCSLVIVMRMPRPWFAPTFSESFGREVRLGVSGYFASLVDFVPILLLPIIVLAAAGPHQNALFYIAFQIVLVLNNSAYAIGNSAFAEASRHPERASQVLKHSAKVMAIVISVGVAGTLLLPKIPLYFFGSQYAHEGVGTLRLLALGSIGVAAAYWAITALRVRRRLAASVLVATVSAGGATLITWIIADGGARAAAIGWCAGHCAGALLGVAMTAGAEKRA
jgi:O-antigen/teichoic acid export membrane protein